MRYQIGETLHAVSLELLWDKPIRLPMGYSWLLEDAISVENIKLHFEALEVFQHHKVADSNHADGERNCDGYVLKSGVHIFFNQFPTASYGQLSDGGDRIFRKQPFLLSKFLESGQSMACFGSHFYNSPEYDDAEWRQRPRFFTLLNEVYEFTLPEFAPKYVKLSEQNIARLEYFRKQIEAHLNSIGLRVEMQPIIEGQSDFTKAVFVAK
jgi:hypothetical protein